MLDLRFATALFGVPIDHRVVSERNGRSKSVEGQRLCNAPADEPSPGQGWISADPPRRGSTVRGRRAASIPPRPGTECRQSGTGWRGSILLVALYRYLPPPGTPLMLLRRVEGYGIHKSWTPIDQVSTNLVRAVITSEDTRFCSHHGFDWSAIETAWDQ